MSKIYLDQEYGVNPSLSLCFVCGEPAGIALLGRSSKCQRRFEIRGNLAV